MNKSEPVATKSRWCRTYGPFEASGGDVETDGDVDANGRSLVIVAQRHLLVDLIGQSQGRLHLNHRAGPESTFGQRWEVTKYKYCVTVLPQIFYVSLLDLSIF